MFRYFLCTALAEENLSFYESVDVLKTLPNEESKREQAVDMMTRFAPYLNISAGLMKVS